ncbi:iron-containing redox enzyme family protein, partial [Methylobacterium haplocladii]
MGEAAGDLSPRGVVADLRNELDRLVAGLDQEPAIKAFKDGSADKALYVDFLVQTRHYVALTAPCLEAAGRRLKELGEHPELAELFFQKADEEAGHDILVDDDLRALGLDPEATLAAHPPGEWITAYNSWITAATNGRHPAAFLGSAYILEGLAVERAGKVAKALVATSSIPKIADAVTFLD